MSASASTQNPLPRATALETAQILAEVQLPMIAKGPIIRRPALVNLAERLGVESRAVTRMQKLSNKYGRGPLLLSLPGINMAMVLDPEHVHRVLEETPEPFSPAERLKRNALKHFEPKSSLITEDTSDRMQRRAVNEEALGHDHPIHRAAEAFMPVVREEAAALLETVDGRAGTLGYDDYFAAWQRVVRRVIFGDSYRDDEELTELIEQQRAEGNWAFLQPVDRKARKKLHGKIHAALQKAEPGSLAHFMSDVPSVESQDTSADEVVQQVPQWLFAFDPAGMASFRSLALLASHPERLDAARLQITQQQHEAAPMLELLRATVLESLRLWATTPLLLRQSTTEVEFEHGVLPEATTVLVFAPFFHRDERHLDFAHRFAPEVWETPRTREDWPLVPFSAGPGICPGRHLVLLLTSNFIAELVAKRHLELTSHRLDPEHLPGLLNNFGLEFRLSR